MYTHYVCSRVNGFEWAVRVHAVYVSLCGWFNAAANCGAEVRFYLLKCFLLLPGRTVWKNETFYKHMYMHASAFTSYAE